MPTTIDPPSPNADLYCPECGYSLRGLTSDRCPECGLVLDFIERGASAIPWEHRKKIGWLRAYWKTVFMVVFRNKLFCREVYREVSYVAARRFSWVCALHVYVSALGVAGCIWIVDGELPGLETGWWFVLIVAVCGLLALIAFTGLPSYFFHPRGLPVDLQNRAIALSYYACASLAFSPLLGILGCVVIVADPEPSTAGNAELLLWSGAAISGILIDLQCWIDVGRIARRTLRSTWHSTLIHLLLPVAWIVVCGLIVVGPPLVAMYVALIYYSLR